jgi:hypothetical protein
MRRTPLLGLAVALLFSASFTACDDDKKSVNTSSASTTSSGTEATSTTTSTTTAAGTITKTSAPAVGPKRFLTDVKALRVDGKDVVQFTFDGGTPGYAGEYITPPITDEGEGAPVAISGGNVVKLVFESSGTVDLTGGTKEYYTGPKTITPADTTTVAEITKVSEYEGRLLFGIGTRTKADFAISASGNIVTVSFG